MAEAQPEEEATTSGSSGGISRKMLTRAAKKRMLSKIKAIRECAKKEMKYYFEYNLHTKEITFDCTLNPRDVPEEETDWLIAANNKYEFTDDNVDKVGLWEIDLVDANVNCMWIQIKQAVKEGYIWHSEVSTGQDDIYSFFVCTLDFCDKDPNQGFKYLEKLTGLGTTDDNKYKEGSITCINTKKRKDYDEEMKYMFEYDLTEREVIWDCQLNPTDTKKEDAPWLWALNSKYSYHVPGKTGKWMLFIPREYVNAVWNQIKMAIKDGHLWHSKVSTGDEDCHAIMIYTTDYTDKEDVINTLIYLEQSGLTSFNKVIKYKSDSQTYAGVYSYNHEKAWIYSSDTIRKEGTHEFYDITKYLSRYDLERNRYAMECNLNPTAVSKTDSLWLNARNNKYNEDENYDPRHVGKWMLIVNKIDVNRIWNEIKKAIEEGSLWRAKVSTGENEYHKIGIYTPDYTDKKAIIETLEYLERSALKRNDQIIRYSIDNKRIEIVRNRPWIYSSDTIRDEGSEQFKKFELEKYFFKYNLKTKTIENDCKFKPTEIEKEESSWLWAQNNKLYATFTPGKLGRWMIFTPRANINDSWNKIKKAIKEGQLWKSKVSTYDSTSDNHLLMVYTPDYNDRGEAMTTLAYLEKVELKPRDQVIRYKIHNPSEARNHQTAWLYSSDTIALSNNTNYFFRYNLNSKEIIDDCQLGPRDVSKKETPWLFARNTKYRDYEFNKVGGWMLQVPSSSINQVWQQIKQAIMNGHLWKSRVSTGDEDSHEVMVYTVNLNDRRDVIQALEFLEKSGLISADKVITYKTGNPTRAGSALATVYSSDTIRLRYGDKTLELESSSGKQRNGFRRRQTSYH